MDGNPKIGGPQKPPDQIPPHAQNQNQTHQTTNVPGDSIEPYQGADPLGEMNAPDPLPEGHRLETSNNPQTGETIETEYDESGEVVRKTTKDSNGTVRQNEETRDNLSGGKTTTVERFNEKGEPDGFTSDATDDNGRLVNHTDAEGDGTRTETTYTYDKEGRLDKAERKIFHPDGSVDDAGNVEFDDNGNVVTKSGNIDGLFDEFIDHGTHTTSDPGGNKVTVIHNPDGTQDVTIITPDGKELKQKLRWGPCYSGPQCPFHPGEGRPLGDSNRLRFGAIQNRPISFSPGINELQAPIISVARSVVNALPSICPPEASALLKNPEVKVVLENVIGVIRLQDHLAFEKQKLQLYRIGTQALEIRSEEENFVPEMQSAVTNSQNSIRQLEMQMEQLDATGKYRAFLNEIE